MEKLIKLGHLKSGNLINWWKIKTGRLVVFAQHTDKFIDENDNMDSYTKAESELSVRIQIILAQGEWSSAKEAEPILKRCGEKQRQTHCDVENGYFRLHYKHLYSWWRITQTIYIPSKIQKISQWNRFFDISEKLISGKSDEIYGVKTINWEDCSWKYLSFVGDEEVIKSLAHKGSRIFRFCVMAWKDERELWTELMVNQWNSSGISSQDSPHCSLSVKSKGYFQDWA